MKPSLTGTRRLTMHPGAHLTLSGTSRLGGVELLRGERINNGRLVVSGPRTWLATVLRGSGVTRLAGATAISGTRSDAPHRQPQHRRRASRRWGIGRSASPSRSRSLQPV